MIITESSTKLLSWRQFVYAFVLPPQLPTDSPPACPPNATANPYQKGSRGQKRQALDEQNFIFQNSEQKRQKRGQSFVILLAGGFAHVAEIFSTAPPPDTYVCRKCNTPGVSIYAIMSSHGNNASNAEHVTAALAGRLSRRGQATGGLCM